MISGATEKAPRGVELLTVVRTPFHFSKRAAGEAAEFTRSGV
jgi:hypothetical protein